MKKRTKLLSYLLTIPSILSVIIILLVGDYREYQLSLSYKTKTENYNPEYVKQWLTALKQDNIANALFFASKMVPKSLPYIPSPYYIILTANSNINSTFFNPPFTKLDYLYWKDVYQLSLIIEGLKTNNNSNDIPSLIFNAVNSRIKTINYHDENFKTIFPSEIWKNKEGTLFDKYFLFSELMLQAGYNTQIIALFYNSQTTPIHLVAESRKKKKVFTCDFLTNTCWYKSLNTLEANPEILEKTWSEEWINALKYKRYQIETSPLSYRLINQELYKYVKRAKDINVPIFGLDPIVRINDFEKNAEEISKNTQFSLGNEPFFVMIGLKDFPKNWLRDPNTKWTKN